ncbi:MAG: amidohydrolase family protein [Oscillospiraceae bacterium]|nr:amidohydrolase family protein [Oscillospiraceae bacterium]
MRTLIKGGTLIDPANQVMAKLNLLVEGGRIAAVTAGEPDCERAIDARGRLVSPGFVDIHMHEDPVESDGRIYSDPEKAIFNCMLRMGVTTAIGGNCGQNCCDPGDYLDIVDRDGAAVNVGMLAGHEFFRRQAGAADKYAHTTPGQRAAMADAIATALDRGCAGLSYGIRYVPGIDREELLATAAPCRRDGKFIAAHIRSDAEEVFDAARELLDTGRELGIPVELSHIGSMAGFGQMERFLAMADEYKMNGLDVSCDCYPYYAFSTTLGSTTYDEGWRDRYHCGYDVVELCEGKYKGRRCTREIFDELRRDDPQCMTVCYVMKDGDVDLAFRHPNVMLASDGIFSHGQGHPRAAGAFPRLLAGFVRQGKLPLYDAIARMTAMPAKKLGLDTKGRLNVGADADIVIFDAEKIADAATFAEPTLHPAGIDYVLIGGETAMERGETLRRDLGRAVRK